MQRRQLGTRSMPVVRAGIVLNSRKFPGVRDGVHAFDRPVGYDRTGDQYHYRTNYIVSGASGPAAASRGLAHGGNGVHCDGKLVLGQTAPSSNIRPKHRLTRLSMTKTLHRTRGFAHDWVVTQEGDTVTLWSGAGVRHTVLDLAAPHLPGLEYAQGTLVALALHPGAQDFLMLGLGGGSIPRMLLAACPNANIEAVEIDPAVPDLARRFFQVGAPPQLQVYVEDAAAYLSHSAKHYDIIIVDTYLGETFPQQCATRDFFENARDRMKPGGVLVINLMGGNPGSYRNVLANVGSSIGTIWLLHGYRSRNTLAFAALREVTRQEICADAALLEKALPFASDLGRLARRLQQYS
jgi:spermidine synthase